MEITLDTETTSLITKLDTDHQQLADIIEISFTYKKGKYSKVNTERFNTTKLIEPGASATNGLTNKMLKDKEIFSQSDSFKLLNQLNKPTNYLVGHNIIEFDEVVLRNNGFDNKMQLIDTLRLTRHIEPKLKSHKLGSLLYELKLNETKAFRDKYGTNRPSLHQAEDDVFITTLLLSYIKTQLRIKGFKHKALTNELIRLSNIEPLLYYMPIGKYRGKTFKEIVSIEQKLFNSSYINWVKDTLNIDIITNFNYWENK